MTAYPRSTKRPTEQTERWESEGAPSTSPQRSESQSFQTRPDSERVRAKAYEIFQTRASAGREGDPESDWLQAERELSGAGADRGIGRDH